MTLLDVLRLAFGNLRRNKLRTALTVSGVVVGIGVIVFLVSLGFGLQNLATLKITNLDALTLITVNPGSREENKLNNEAVEKFKRINGVKKVGPLKNIPSQVKIDQVNLELTLTGIEPDNADIEDLKTKWGATLKNDDEVVITKAALKNLDMDNFDSIIGKEITIKAIPLDKNNNLNEEDSIVINLKIAGVTSEDKNKIAYISLKNLEKINVDYKAIKVKVTKDNKLKEVRQTIENMGYPTTAIKDKVDEIGMAFFWANIVLSIIGGMALLVAAIGIFNTMTISLLERTHEIGIMKAIGGRDKDVARIFTFEAAIIGFLGGCLGVFSGWFGGILINFVANMIAKSVKGEQSSYFYTPWWFALSVVSIAFVISTVSGIWPAKRAARLDPLEALRYE